MSGQLFIRGAGGMAESSSIRLCPGAYDSISIVDDDNEQLGTTFCGSPCFGSSESLAHLGIGAVVLADVTVGFEAIVGGGAVVLKEAPARCTVVGIPAKALAL